MAKTWTMVAHADYFRTLRTRIIDPGQRYEFVIAIWDHLQETDDPTRGAIPVKNKIGRYELKLTDYTLIFDLPIERPNNIDLLEIY